MAASEKSKEMLDYFNQLDIEEHKSVLQMLQNYLFKRKGTTAPPSLEKYTKELEKADAEIESGDFVMHEDVVKYFTKK